MRERMPSFDTHRYVKDLQQAGFNEIQAESIIRSLLESRDADISQLATKEQVNVLKEQMNALEKIMATKEDLKSLEHNLGLKISEVQITLMKWMIGTVLAFSGLILGAVKLFFH